MNKALKTALWKTNEGQDPLAVENFWFSGLAWWLHTQLTELFCQSFSLVAEVNLSENFGDQACSRQKADQNARVELLPQNLTGLFLPSPKLQDSYCCSS